MADTVSVSFAESTMNAIAEWARPDGHKISPYVTYPFASASAGFWVAIGYLAFVAIGSQVMKARGEPIKGLYGFKFLYNIIQVMLCSYMCIEAGIRAYKGGYTLLPCEPFSQENSVIGDVLYIFYMSKILDFVDTIFIIAECRWKQLTFLHVYHHFTIFLFYWLNLTVGYDGDVYLTIVLNGLIHAIMYTYYFVSLHVTETIWWKPFLTKCQMIQFCFMMLQSGYLMLASPKSNTAADGTITWSQCDLFPRKIIAVYFWYIASLLGLFMHFHIQDVKAAAAKKKAVKAGDAGKTDVVALTSENRRNSGSAEDYDNIPIPLQRRSVSAKGRRSQQK